MADPTIIVTITAGLLTAIAIVTAASLSGWRDWLNLERQRISAGRATATNEPAPAGVRIELADLKERIRKLEAIAAGIDL